MGESAGTEIVVPNVQREELPRKIARVEVSASEQRVRAYDKEHNVVAVYPATVGSSERPSPQGELKVTAIAENPTYHYDPALNLKGVDVQEKLELPPGPKNPVGVVWIALSAKGYGIHGTPDPEAVSKRASHGCIRLTNWDALELAKHVSKGTRVSIEMECEPRPPSRTVVIQTCTLSLNFVRGVRPSCPDSQGLPGPRVTALWPAAAPFE